MEAGVSGSGVTSKTARGVEFRLRPTGVLTISEEAGTTDKIHFTNSPEEALKDADIVITDTW